MTKQKRTPKDMSLDERKFIADCMKKDADFWEEFYSGQGFPVTTAPAPGPAMTPKLYEPFIEAIKSQNGKPDNIKEDPARSEENNMLELASLEGILDDKPLIAKLEPGEMSNRGLEAVGHSCQTCSSQDHARMIARVAKTLATMAGKDMSEVPDVPLLDNEQAMKEFLGKVELVTKSLALEQN